MKKKALARRAFIAGLVLGRNGPKPLPGPYGTRTDRAFEDWWYNQQHEKELRARAHELQSELCSVQKRLRYLR